MLLLHANVLLWRWLRERHATAAHPATHGLEWHSALRRHESYSQSMSDRHDRRWRAPFLVGDLYEAPPCESQQTVQLDFALVDLLVEIARVAEHHLHCKLTVRENDREAFIGVPQTADIMHLKHRLEDL